RLATGPVRGGRLNRTPHTAGLVLVAERGNQQRHLYDGAEAAVRVPGPCQRPVWRCRGPVASARSGHMPSELFSPRSVGLWPPRGAAERLAACAQRRTILLPWPCSHRAARSTWRTWFRSLAAAW